MTLTIGLIEDRGYSKTLHLHIPNSNEVQCTVTVGENHPWFESVVGDKFILSLDDQK